MNCGFNTVVSPMLALHLRQSPCLDPIRRGRCACGGNDSASGQTRPRRSGFDRSADFNPPSHLTRRHLSAAARDSRIGVKCGLKRSGSACTTDVGLWAIVPQATRMERDSLEVARRADVRLGQPLLLPPLALLLPLGEGGVHDVVHLRVVVAVDVADLGVFDVDRGHGERRP